MCPAKEPNAVSCDGGFVDTGQLVDCADGLHGRVEIKQVINGAPAAGQVDGNGSTGNGGRRARINSALRSGFVRIPAGRTSFRGEQRFLRVVVDFGES